MKYDRILLEHGGGGQLTGELIEQVFLPRLGNPHLMQLTDSAFVAIGDQRICFTTDSYVVSPLFFPGGDIGSLAVHGTVNDLAVCGAQPLFLSAGFIVEEGFATAQLEQIVDSMASAAALAGVQVVTGDTKVVPHGAADGLYITTSGIGRFIYDKPLSPSTIRTGDAVIVNGPVGDHGAAILCARQDLGFLSTVLSDSAPLESLVNNILKASPNIHCMRDATRGGLGAVLAEIAQQSGHDIYARENDIPLRESVRGICEMLGYDPLYLANEGKLVVFCAADDAPAVLAAMQRHELGHEATRIGTVQESGRGRVVLTTIIGGERVIDRPTGELVPRIC
jgi:hydrogenase expression/formation protein HypE